MESGRVQGRCVIAGQGCEKVHKRCQAGQRGCAKGTDRGEYKRMHKWQHAGQGHYARIQCKSGCVWMHE